MKVTGVQGFGEDSEDTESSLGLACDCGLNLWKRIVGNIFVGISEAGNGLSGFECELSIQVVLVSEVSQEYRLKYTLGSDTAPISGSINHYKIRAASCITSHVGLSVFHTFAVILRDLSRA